MHAIITYIYIQNCSSGSAVAFAANIAVAGTHVIIVGGGAVIIDDVVVVVRLHSARML